MPKKGDERPCDKARTKIVDGVPSRQHPLYRVWSGIKDRCFSSTHNSYPRYGGRGIGMCSRWKESFELFCEDVGPRPSRSHSIDRFPDNDGHYEPGNVRWATKIEQGNNRRDNIVLEIEGQKKTVTDWARESGIAA